MNVLTGLTGHEKVDTGGEMKKRNKDKVAFEIIGQVNKSKRWKIMFNICLQIAMGENWCKHFSLTRKMSKNAK